jgi:hypothetical protein
MWSIAQDRNFTLPQRLRELPTANQSLVFVVFSAGSNAKAASADLRDWAHFDLRSR